MRLWGDTGPISQPCTRGQQGAAAVRTSRGHTDSDLATRRGSSRSASSPCSSSQLIAPSIVLFPEKCTCTVVLLATALVRVSSQ